MHAIKSPGLEPRRAVPFACALLLGIIVAGGVVGCVHPRAWEQLPNDRALDVASYNVLYLNRDLGRLAETLRTASPDVVGLCEVTPGARAALETAIADVYPYRHFAGEFALLSKRALHDVEHIRPEYGRKGALLGSVQVGDARVKVLMVHLVAPELDEASPAGAFRALATAEAAHEQELAWFSRRLGPGPAVVMGDFNAMPFQPARALMLKRGFRDAAAATRVWPGPTWEGPLFGLGASLRIDYVFVRGLTPKNTREISSIASDHALLQAALALP